MTATEAWGWGTTARRLLLLFFFAALAAWFAPTGDALAGVSRSIVQSMQSETSPEEVDTADRPDGQAGGRQLGRGYQLKTLRCQQGEVIVGTRIRRGQVVDFLQIACARPACTESGCRWSNLRWGMSAGSASGGAAMAPMVCAADEIMTGFRGRVMTFTVFDYASDIEIQCTAVDAAPGAKGLGRSSASNWRHWGPGLTQVEGPGTTVADEQTPDISCLPDGTISAVSTAESDFLRRGQRIVQAISLYCAKGRKSEAGTAEVEAIIRGLDQCLREESGIAFYSMPSVATYSGRATYDGAADTILYDPAYLAGQRPYAKAFWLAAAFGGHIVNLEKRQYGTTRTPAQYVGERDVISGYLIHCLVIRGVLPRVTNMSEDDPRLQYDAFLAQGGFLLPGDPPGVQQYRADWEQGWRLQGMTLAPSILPPR